MKYITAKGQKMSAFSLGTVQLGKAYGLGEAREKMSEETAFSILDTAMENGVDNLDTANNYGDSEALIGRWLQKRRTEGKSLPWVVTKIGPLKHGSFDILRDDILRQTEGCCKNLGVETLDYLPWAILCYTGFIFAIIYGFTGFGIAKLDKEETKK